MKTLFLTQILPYPLDAGPKVKTWQVLRYLVACGHEVTLVSFVRAEEEKHIADVRKLLPSFVPVPIRRSRPADARYLLRSLFTGQPFLVERDGLPAMHQAVRSLCVREGFDVIHADQLTMTQFAFAPECMPPGKKVTRVFDAHNATWSILAQMRGKAPAPLRPLVGQEADRVKRYEARIVRAFDWTMTVTDIDRELLIRAVRETGSGGVPTTDAANRIVTIPITVDTNALPAVTRPDQSVNILTLGTLHYPPNADGIRWFLNEVFPRVREVRPQVTLTIVGKNPPADFLEQARAHPEAVQVTGYVPELKPYLEQAALMVVPVRAGGGMRVRILEAFSRGIPTVTTTIGLEGIEAQNGEDVLVADTPESFAAAVVSLLDQPELRSRLAANGRRLAEQVYDWQVVLKKMDTIYADASG
jgi:glycosyltransferase involved in cell wall biosynthesis